MTQYKAVLIVMNEFGQVIAWLFTKSTSVDEGRALLEGIRGRLKPSDSPLLILADNCCLIRNKLEEIFGNVVVKLDLFHAVQRITRRMSKKHPFYSQCTSDIKLLFRHPTDLGKNRKLITPKPMLTLKGRFFIVIIIVWTVTFDYCKLHVILQ